MGKITLASLLLLASFEALSLSQNDLSDMGFVYPGVQLLKSGEFSSGERLLVESAVKRIDNNMSIEAKRIVTGTSKVYIFKLSESSNLKDVYLYYKSALESKGALSYNCAKRECGINNYWANNVFGDSQLKGRDSSQYYTVGRLSVNGTPYFASVYVVSNFLRKKLVRLEFVPVPVVNNPNVDSVGAGWQQGYLLKDKHVREGLIAKLRLIKGLSSVEIVAFSKNDQRITSEQEAEIFESMANVKSSIAKELGGGVSIDTFVAGHRNIESEKDNELIWFRIFAY